MEFHFVVQFQEVNLYCNKYIDLLCWMKANRLSMKTLAVGRDPLPPFHTSPNLLPTPKPSGVLFLLIRAKKQLVSKRLAGGVSRCDLSQGHLHVNRGYWEPRNSLQVSNERSPEGGREGWAQPPGALLCRPRWFGLCGWLLVWASLQLLLQRSGLEKNKAIVFVPRQVQQCQGRVHSAQLGVWTQ